jgi:hypothetical protein
MTDKGLLIVAVGSCRRPSSTCRHDQKFSGCSGILFLLTSKATASTEILGTAEKGIADERSQRRVTAAPPRNWAA